MAAPFRGCHNHIESTQTFTPFVMKPSPFSPAWDRHKDTLVCDLLWLLILRCNGTILHFTVVALSTICTVHVAFLKCYMAHSEYSLLIKHLWTYRGFIT